MLVILATACAGCTTEVDPGTLPDASEVPFSDAKQASEPVAAPKPEEEPLTPPASSSPARSAAREQPEGLPWDSTSESGTEAAPDLFGSVASAPSGTAAPPPPEETELDDMESFLEQQYGADLLGEASEEEENDDPEITKPEPKALASTPAPPALPPEAAAVSLDELWGPPANPTSSALPKPGPPAEPEPARDAIESLPADNTVLAEVEPPPASPAKQPTTTEAVESPSFEELWGEPPAESKPREPLPPPESTAVLPEPAPAVTPEPLPLPRSEPASADQPAAADPTPRVASHSPLAAESIDTLPGVPVLSYNTRHLSWLLGGKLGLAKLADLDGATPSEIDSWSGEASRLADQLRVELASVAEQPGSAPERVQRLIGQAGELGAEVARRHGDDHAALLEIAVKTNALLVLAAERPELAEPVGRAIGAAAERALLPRFLWIDAVRSLRNDASPEEIHDAVVRLHQRVEPFLR